MTIRHARTTRRLVRDLAGLMLAPRDVLFLRACLAPEREARLAWTEWTTGGGAIGDASTEAGGRVKAFAPLVLAAVERGVLPVGRPDITTLKAWRLLERNRIARYRSVLHEVLESLASAGVRPVILKGLSLADTVYPDPELRHSHDIDLLLPPGDVARARRALRAPEFIPLRTSPRRESTTLLHASRLPITLHATFCRVPYYRLPVEDVISASQRFVCGGVAARRLRSDHALLQICAQGLGKGRGAAAIRWAVDVWHLVGRDESLDWTMAVEEADRHRLALLMAASLTAVADGLQAGVNRRALSAFCAAAGRELPSGVRRLVPLTAAAPRSLSELRAWRGGWLGQTSVALAMLAPSADYIRWARGNHATTAVAAAYARRLFVPLRVVVR